jgi:hypothetical protein
MDRKLDIELVAVAAPASEQLDFVVGVTSSCGGSCDRSKEKGRSRRRVEDRGWN